MKICTRCFARDGSVKIAIDTLISQQEDIHIDICVDCKEAIDAFVNNPGKVKKPGRPKKDGT